MKEKNMHQSFKGFLTSLTELTDKQKNIDKNHNGKLDAQDFKMLRKEDAKCPECGMPESKCDCDHMSEQSPVAPTLDKKYIKGTPENKAHKEKNKPINGHPTNSMKEAINDNLHPAGAALLKHIKPEHHNKYKAHLTTDTFNGSYKDRTDVLNAAKKAGHLKEETELDELSKTTLGSYAKKASRDAVITRKIGADFEHKADAARSPGMKAASNELSSKYKQKSWKRRDGLEKAVDRLSKEEVELGEAFINGREYASHGLMHPDHAKMDIHQPANREVDFYASKTGDKMHGKVMKNDGKEVHIQAHKQLGDGKLHKFKVTPNLPKTTNEAVKKDDVPFDGPYTKTSGDGTVKDKSGAVHGPMSRARDLARKAMQKKMKEEFNIEITEEQAADLCDTVSLHEKMDMAKADMGDVIKDFKKSDAPQFAGKSDEKRRQMAIAAKLQADRGGKKSYREFVELIAPQIQEGSPDEKEVDVAENAFDWKKSKTSASSGRYDIKQDGNRTIVTRKYNPDTGHSTGTDDDEKPAGEKRGRGRPAGSTSGAKQKGSANKSDYRGIDYKTHSLHLPNSK